MTISSLRTKIRQHRKRRELTLVDLAEQCEISPSFLSQIERDRANPSVGTLHEIAQAFGLTMAAFFDGPDAKADSRQPVESVAQVVRADQRKVLIYPGSGNRNELLSPDLQRRIQMMWTMIPPGGDTGDVSVIHEGEECGVVLQGKVEMWVGDEHYVLGPGDSFYHPCSIPHRSRNIGDDDVIVVVAITPPSF